MSGRYKVRKKVVTLRTNCSNIVGTNLLLINNKPESDRKSDDSSKNEEKPLKKLDDDDEPKKVDDDKPKNADDDDDDDDEPKNTDDDDDDDDEPTGNKDDDQTGFTLSIQDKSFKFNKSYVDSVKNALSAGYTMKDYDANYKAHDLTKDTLADYLAIETKYGSTNASIIDANGDDVIDIYGTKDYSLKGDQASNKVSAAKFEKLYYHSTLPLTLPGNNKISCYNTTKKDVVKMYGDVKESSVGIVHYHKDGLDLAFHFDSQGTVSALFIRID